MQVAPSASTYAPAPGDLVSQTPAGSAHLFADPYQAPQQDPTGAFADSSPGSFGDTGSQDQPDPPYLRADTALASTSLFASTGITSSTLAQMVQAQTKPLLVTAENAAGLNLPPQTGSAAPASATAPATPTASPTEIAALELLLAEPANQEIIAQFGPPLRPLNTDTDVGQGILARFGPDLGARLTQLQEAHNAVRDEFLQALDQAQQNPGPGVAGSALIAQHTSGGDAQHVTEQTLHFVTHPPSASQASDLQAIEAQTLAAGGQQQNLWRLSDPAEFAKAYAAGDSPAQKAFAQLHGKEPLQFNAAVQHGETDAGPQITPAYYSLGENHLVLGGPTVTENGNPGPWAASTWQATQLTPEQNRDLINNEYLWFDPVNGWSTDLANNIRQSTSLLDKALPMVFAGVMTFATAGVFGITAASASASLGQSMALGAIGSATMQLTTGGKIDLGDLLRSALTAGVTFGVTNLTGLGTARQSADLATRSLGHLGKAGLQGLLQEATGGQFKDGLTNSLLASVAGEVGKSLDSHIAALSENGELSVQEASMLKLLSRAASSAVKVVGSSDPAAGFASDFLGEVLGEELRGAQAKAPSQSQAPSQNTGQNPSQTANGAGDRPSSDWVRNLGPSEVDAQGLWPGPAGQGLQISGDALSHWSGEIDGGIALNGSMAPGAQAITEAVVGQGQGPLAALAAAGLDKHQQIAAYGQLVASGQVQLNAQGIPIVQPGQVLQFDLSDTRAAQLGGRAIAQESVGRAQRQAQAVSAAQQAAETYAGGAGGGRGFVNPALASEHSHYPFAGRSTITDPAAYKPPMSYGEQMQHVGEFFGDVGIGAAKGLVNALPETAAWAYRMTGYAAAGVVSLVDTDMSDRMFAQYEKVTGRVAEYDNGLQEVSGLISGLVGPSNALRGAAVAGDIARARVATSIRVEYELGWNSFVTSGLDVTGNPAVLNSSVAQALRGELLASGRPMGFAVAKTEEILKSGMELPTMRNASTGEFFYKLQPLDVSGNPLNSVYWMNSSQYSRVQGMNAAEIANAMGLPAPSAAHGAVHGFRVFETTPRIGASPLVFESQIAPATQGAHYAARGLDYQTLIANPKAWYPARPIGTIAGVR